MKAGYILTVLAAFLAALAQAEYADNFCNDKDDGYFADPKNCIKYYHCFNKAVEDRLTCPEDNGVFELYDEEHTWCNFPNKVDCGDRPICDENDENCNEVTTSGPHTTGKPDFVCPEPSGYFADPNNCIKYWHCFEGVPEEHLTCDFDNAGKRELWDTANTWCDHPERVDCGDRPICDENDENCTGPDDKTTTPIPDFECPQPSGYFADPKNCIKYFHCYENVVEEHITCPKANGQQECYDEVKVLCDYPERVNCGNRPICDENDENCITPTTPTVPTGPTPSPGPTTTKGPDRCAKYNPCQMDQDGMGPYHTEGPCEQCFCQCVQAGVFEEVCCEPGLFFNEKIEQCDWPFNIPDCQ